MKHALVLGVIASAVMFAAHAHAAPSCTGTTDTVASGGSVPSSFLLGAGNCVDAGDKVFGDFAVVNAGGGTASFTFLNPFGNVTLGFSGAINPSTTATLHYQVAVQPSALALGWRIDDLQKDFTLNAADGSGSASATLTGTTTPATNPPIAIDCDRTVNPSGGSCPQTAVFAAVDALAIDETLVTDANAIVTALTDTISQVQVVPEPGALALLGVGLLGLCLVRRRA